VEFSLEMWRICRSLILNRCVSVGWAAIVAAVTTLVVADWFLPDIIADAYAGKGPGRLVGFFATRRDRHSLDHYLTLWRNFRNAGLIAAAFYGIILILIDWLIKHASMRAWMVSFAAVFLAMTVLWGPRQDYVAHLKIWDEVNVGHDPWWIQPESGIVLNAYGPLFEALAPLAWLNPLGPKILFAFVYLIYAVWIMKLAEESHSKTDWYPFWAFAWLANPFFWLEIAFYGHFDVLAAIFVVSSFAAFRHSRSIIAGSLIGLGFLLKFVPAVLAPFLAIEFRDGIRIRWRFAMAALCLIAGGMAIAWGIWGKSVFRPLAFVSTRGSSLLSVWRYLKGTHSPLAQAGLSAPDLDRFATPVLLLALGLLWAFTTIRRTERIHACLIAMIATLAFYRVGFVQYQMFVFLMLPIWYFRHKESIEGRLLLKLSLGAYIAWIVGFDLFDNAVGGIVGHDRPFAWLEEWVGLPNFVVSMSLLATLVNMPAIDRSCRE
jgi:hypothetical protein